MAKVAVLDNREIRTVLARVYPRYRRAVRIARRHPWTRMCVSLIARCERALMSTTTPQPPPPNGLCNKCSQPLDSHEPWSPYVKNKDQQPDLKCPTSGKTRIDRCMQCGDSEWKHGGLCSKCYEATGPEKKK